MKKGFNDQTENLNENLNGRFNDQFEKLSEIMNGLGIKVNTGHIDQKKFEEKVTRQMDQADINFEAFKQEQRKETENYKNEVSKNIEDQMKMAMDIHTANLNNQMESLHNDNRKNWQEFKRQHDISTSSKSEVKQLETTVASQNKKVTDDVKEIETEVKNLNSKIEEKPTHVTNDAKHMKGIWKLFQPKIQATEEKIELQRTESRDLQQKIEEIEQETKEKQNDLNENVNALRHDMSTDKEKTQAELGNFQQMLDNQKKEMRELTDRHTSENQSFQKLMEENEKQPKQEKFEQPIMNTLTEDTIMKVFQAMMDAEKNHINSAKKEENEKPMTRAEVQQMVKEMSQTTKPNESPPIVEGFNKSFKQRELERYTELLEAIKECLPLLILEEDEDLAAQCKNAFRGSDTKGIKVEPLSSSATLEQKYKAIVTLQIQLQFKYIKFSKWGIFLSMLVGRTVNADLKFPSTVTTDKWLKMLLILLKRHDVRQERIDHVYAMLQQRPTKSDDLTGWLELFVKQVEQAGSGDHSIPTKQAVRDILTEQGALFNGRLLSKTKSLEQIILFVEDLNLPNKKPKPKIQDQEANEIAMEVNEFYDNYNSKHLNYTNKKFIKQTGERTKYEHSHRYWSKN
ncbi:hypothetical protein B5S30_g5799 [[Candida] boidinii]|nr:hypothetical protein B5S30_g5799 [[Candida] boidinii]